MVHDLDAENQTLVWAIRSCNRFDIRISCLLLTTLIMVSNFPLTCQVGNFVTTQRNGKKHKKARTATILSRTVTAQSALGSVIQVFS